MELGMVGFARMGENMERACSGAATVSLRMIPVSRHWALVLEISSKIWYLCSRHPGRCGPLCSREA